MPFNPIARMTSPDAQNVFAANHPRQSVRRLPQFIFATLIVVALVQLGLSLARGRYERAAADAQQRRHELSLLIDEWRQTTDELTRMARTFVVTGNPVFENYFNEILAIRDGRKPRPAHYDKVYWDLVITHGQPAATGPVESLDARMARAGFVAEELAKLGVLKRGADQLALLERMAMNAAQGVFRDSSGQFTRRGAPDQAYAARILHGAEYHQGRGQVMLPVHQTQLLLDRRTSAAVAVAAENLRHVARFEIALIGVSVLLLAGSFMALTRRLIEPIEQLSASAVAVGRNGFFRRVLVEREDELGALAGAMNRLSETVEEKLCDSEANEARFRSLLEAAPDALILSDVDGRITAINLRAEALLGVGRAEIEGQLLATLLPGLGAAGQTRRPDVSFEIKLHAGTAGELTIEAIQNVIDRADGSVLVCTALRDRSVSKAAREALDRQTQVQRASLDAVRSAVFALDEAGRITAVNQAFEDVFGLAREAVTGKSLLDLDFMADAERRQLQVELGGLGQPGARMERDLPVLARDGFERMMHFAAEGVRFADNSPGGVVAILTDVTERRRAEADVVATQKELARAGKEAAALKAALASAHAEMAGLRGDTAAVRTQAESLGSELAMVRAQLADALDAGNARAAELKRELDDAHAPVSVDATESKGADDPRVPDLADVAGLPDEQPAIAGAFDAETGPFPESDALEVAELESTWEAEATFEADEVARVDAAAVEADGASASVVDAPPDALKSLVDEFDEPVLKAITPATSPALEPGMEAAGETGLPTATDEEIPDSIASQVAVPLAEAAAEEPRSAASETASAAEAQPGKRKRTPRKKKEKTESQVDLFGGYDGAKDDAGPVQVTSDPDGVPVVSGLDLREAINRLELPVSAVVKKVIHFAEGLPQTFGELRSALAAADHETARRHAHSVAGAAGTFAADTLRRLAKTLELALKFEQGDAARMLTDLEHEAGRVMEAARQLATTVSDDPGEQAPSGSPAPPAKRRLLTILEELSAALDEGELEAIGPVVDKLKAESLPDALQADYDRLSELIDSFEYADAAVMVRSMMERAG